MVNSPLNHPSFNFAPSGSAQGTIYQVYLFFNSSLFLINSIKARQVREPIGSFGWGNPNTRAFSFPSPNLAASIWWPLSLTPKDIISLFSHSFYKESFNSLTVWKPL